MEGDAQTREVEHRQVVRPVADGHRLRDVDRLELAQQPQQLGLAAPVDDLADVAAREAAVLDLEFVGVDVVEAVFLAQVVAEVGEAAREDRRLVAHALEDGHHAFEPLGDGKVAGNVLHDRDVEPLEQGDALREALAEVDLAAHGAGRDLADPVADAGPFGQFVDHLRLDERRVHVEADQAAAAAVDVVLLEGDVESDLGEVHEALLHGAAVGVGERAAHRELDARLGGAVVLVEGHAARQAPDGVDVQPVLGHDLRHLGNVARRDGASEQRDDVAVLALTGHPVVVALFGDRREADHHPQLRGLEEQLLHDVARLVGRGQDQDAERQRLVDVGLSDVEDEGVVARENLRERRGHAGLVFARNVYLDDFDVVLCHKDCFADYFVRIVNKVSKVPRFLLIFAPQTLEIMWTFLAAESAEPLILPDSVQKANLAKAVEKIATLDYHEVLQTMLSEAVWIVIKIVIALAIYFLGRWIVRRVVRLIDVAMERRKVDISLRSFMRNTVRVVFSLILVLIVVQTLGVNVTSLIAVFSAATLAIGMALSGTAQNFAGGVMILMMKPYRVGDYISAQGQSGTVREIKLFSTVITTNDNQTIYIPNNAIATAIIDNYTTAEQRRVDWTVGISYGDDVDVARETILAMLAADARILRETAPVVWVAALADSSVNLTVRAWVANADYWDVFFEYNERFYKELPKAGINFPFPQMDVHVKND